MPRVSTSEDADDISRDSALKLPRRDGYFAAARRRRLRRDDAAMLSRRRNYYYCCDFGIMLNDILFRFSYIRFAAMAGGLGRATIIRDVDTAHKYAIAG